MPNNNAPQPPATPTPATPTAKTVTNAKTAAELWNALYRWATAVLPKKVKVVKSHQDMASVKGTFICINYAGSWNLAGSNATWRASRERLSVSITPGAGTSRAPTRLK